jgi:Derlin-2/3
MDSNSPEAWFKGLPPVTRTLLVVLFSTTCLVVAGFVDVHIIFLDWFQVTRKYQFWRLFTGALFLGGFSFGFVMQLYFFTNFGSKLETHQRFNQPGDYLFFLIVISVLVAIFSLLLQWPRGYPMTGPSIIFALIYYWSRCEPEARMSIWGFEVKGYQLPFALVFLTMLMGGDIWKDVLGIAAGHLYHFMKDVVPVEYKMDLLKTPRLFKHLVGRVSRTQPQVGAPAGGQPQDRPNRLFVGGGYRLGGI